MTKDELKVLVGEAAAALVEPGAVIGVGTGSTVNCFIDALAARSVRIAGAVSSSEQTSERLRRAGIPVVDAGDVTRLALYVDGADEIDHDGHMIKGGGAALTREKIVADLSDRFVCIADGSKLVQRLGAFPVPIEVIAMASGQIARRLRELGGQPTLRPGVLTDNGHPILDVRGLVIEDPVRMEAEINQWPGVVCVGIFARHRAASCLLGTDTGVRTMNFRSRDTQVPKNA